MSQPAPPSPTAVIADDERLLREQLRARLAEVWPELEIVAEAKNGAEAVELVEEHRPDVVFLDIRMPGMNGIEAARAIAQLPVDDDDAETEPTRPPWRGAEIVFITAYDQYAIEAFEQGVIDYVLKPAERERLQVTVDRVRKRLADRGSDDAPDASGMQDLLQKLADEDEPGRGAAAEVDPGDRRHQHPDDPGRGRAVLHLRREVHAGADRARSRR